MKMHCLANRRGAALVEFSVVVNLLLTLVLGVMEFANIMKSYLELDHAAREGSRIAALGGNTARLSDRILSATPTLDSSRLTINLYTRTGTAGSWGTLGDTSDGVHNNALTGDQVKVKLTYSHLLIAGSFFSWLASGGDSMTVRGEMVMSRE